MSSGLPVRSDIYYRGHSRPTSPTLNHMASVMPRLSFGLNHDKSDGLVIWNPQENQCKSG